MSSQQKGVWMMRKVLVILLFIGTFGVKGSKGAFRSGFSLEL
jgi:hypothetical protein